MAPTERTDVEDAMRRVTQGWAAGGVVLFLGVAVVAFLGPGGSTLALAALAVLYAVLMAAIMAPFLAKRWR